MTQLSGKTRSRIGGIAAAITAALLLATTTPASAAEVSRVEGPFVSVTPTALADNPAGVELMFMECDWVQRVVHKDGSATETQQCQLTDPFVVFPGTPPDTAFINIGPPCIWESDYLLTTTGEVVLAETGRLIVTPSGQVHVKTHYPAEPLDC